MLNQVCVKIVTDPARKQTLALLGDGAKHVFGYLLVCLHSDPIGVAVGIIDACTDEYGIGVD